MTEESQPPVINGSEVALRPDPIFKLYTTEEALQAGLKLKATEKQHTTYADLVLEVPPGVSTESTIFDFFRTVNVLEFKSQGDPFDLREYVRTSLRTSLVFLEGPDENLDNILNVIISSRLPQKFFEQARQRGVIFRADKERPWLWEARAGVEDVAVVVCRDLPIERRYYAWLLFAPATTHKWQNFLFRIWLEKNEVLLKLAKDLRPKEFEMVSKTLQELIADGITKGIVKPEELYEMQNSAETNEAVDSATYWLSFLEEEEPQKLAEVLATIKPEERLTGLKPEERLAGLTPEERRKLLKLLQESEQAEGQDAAEENKG